MKMLRLVALFLTFGVFVTLSADNDETETTNAKIYTIPCMVDCQGNINCTELLEVPVQEQCDNCTANAINCNVKGKRFCLHEKWVCDGENDCDGGADENDEMCMRLCDSTKITISMNKKCQIRDSDCARRENLCDGKHDCRDGKDENDTLCRKVCEKSSNNVTCANSSKCARLCNGVMECSDGADEKGCESLNCLDPLLKCVPENRCLALDQICNGIDDCEDGSDEMNCHKKCSKFSEVKSQQGITAVLIALKMLKEADSNYRYHNHMSYKAEAICGRISICQSSDSWPVSRYFKNVCNQAYCKQIGKLHCNHRDAQCTQGTACDGHPDCPNQSDEKNCDKCVGKSYFCKARVNGGKSICLANSKICDGIQDCHGGSDEYGCKITWECKKPETSKHENDTQKQTIEASKLCNGFMDCKDGSDEEACRLLPMYAMTSANLQNTTHGRDVTPTKALDSFPISAIIVITLLAVFVVGLVIAVVILSVKLQALMNPEDEDEEQHEGVGEGEGAGEGGDEGEVPMPGSIKAAKSDPAVGSQAWSSGTVQPWASEQDDYIPSQKSTSTRKPKTPISKVTAGKKGMYGKTKLSKSPKQVDMPEQGTQVKSRKKGSNAQTSNLPKLNKGPTGPSSTPNAAISSTKPPATVPYWLAAEQEEQHWTAPPISAPKSPVKPQRSPSLKAGLPGGSNPYQGQPGKRQG